MSSGIFLLSSLLATLCLPTVAGGQETAPEGATLSRHESRSIEEIVVTARRRAELLEDTPISVTALSEATLREAGVTRLDEIQELVPNLQMPTGRSGLEGRIRIRGIGTSTSEVAFDPGVGVYVDGVYLPRSLGQLVDVLDIEQVEVLRGPQGTLFGKNTVGGALNITTVKPTQQLEAWALLRPGNLGSLHTRMMVNTPIGTGWLRERLAARVAFSSTNRRGYTYNTFRNEYWSDTNSLAFLGSLRFTPVDDVSINVSGSWSRNHGRQRGGQCLVVRETVLGNLQPGLYDACRASGKYEFEADPATIADVESYGTWGTIAWDVGEVGPIDHLKVKSITSWRQQHPRGRDDFDMTEFPVIQLASVGGGVLDGEPGFQQQISQEIQLNASAWDDRLNFVGGYFVLWEKGTALWTIWAMGNALDAATTTDVDFSNWTWAPFAQATLDMTDWASLTAGLRYTEDKKGLHLLFYDPRMPEPPQLDRDKSVIFSAWTPMGSLALRLPDEYTDGTPLNHLMGYFTYSRGFKGGGFDAVTSPFAEELNRFDPETLDSFEFGVKTISFEQRVTLNLSLFLGNYEDIQITKFQDLGDTDGDGLPNLQRVTLNAASGTTKGLELELQALPMDGLRITGSVGLLDARYDDFEGLDDVTGDNVDRAGQRFLLTPEIQSHIAIQYSLPVSFAGPQWLQGWITPRVDWSYQGNVLYLGPEIPQGTQSGYNLVHLRVSYDFLDDRAQVGLWTRNLLDEAYFDYAFSSSSSFGTGNRWFQVGRTYGAELSYRL
ncbi:MAG: TonB-dependent receptor [Candidatus Binatia bacterium]|nr:TonB-dependent receptor [Candidatus Binatia bacterium]